MSKPKFVWPEKKDVKAPAQHLLGYAGKQGVEEKQYHFIRNYLARFCLDVKVFPRLRNFLQQYWFKLCALRKLETMDDDEEEQRDHEMYHFLGAHLNLYKYEGVNRKRFLNLHSDFDNLPCPDR